MPAPAGFFAALRYTTGMEPKRTDNLHGVFIASLILKGLNALIEIAASCVILLTGALTGVFSIFFHSIESSAHTQLFVAAYLFIHGVVKIFIVIGLFSRRHWAYAIAEIALFLFIAYQMYEYLMNGSAWLLGLSIFDTFLLWLTWREHRLMKSRL